MRRLLLVTLLAAGVHAQTPIPLDPARGEIALDGHLGYLADPGADLTLDDVRTARRDAFRPTGPVLEREQQRPEVFWLRLRLQAPEGRSSTWALETPAERIEVFWLGPDGEAQRRVAGTAVSKAERAVQQGYPSVIGLSVEGGEVRTLWVRVLHDPDGPASTSELRVLRLKPAAAAALGSRALALLNGLFFGFLLALALYNLSLYAGFRDLSFLYYVGYVVGIGVYFLTIYRYAFDALAPASVGWTPEVQTVAVHAAAVCYPLFVRHFLGQERIGTVLSRLLLVAAALSGLGLLVILAAGWRVGGAWTSACVLAQSGVSLLALWRAWRTGYAPAGLLLASYVVITVSTAGYLAPYFGASRLEGTMEMMQVGIALEAFLLALALTSRVRDLRSARVRALTEKHQAEADRLRIEESNAALQEAVLLKSNLLGFAAHDLRSPLTTVLGFAEMIRDGDTDPGTVAEYGGHIQDSATRLLRLIDDLLVTAALDGGHVRVRAEPVDLGAFVEAAVRPFGPLAAAKEQRLAVHAPPGCTARIDPDRFQEVVDNLVSNAIKYTPPGGAVEVEVRGTRREVWLCVGDSGPGLTAADREGLFRPFTQLSARPTGGEASTGLGLSIVKQIVDLHGGRVEVDSEPGRGARFTVVLDAAAATPASPPQPEAVA